MAYSAEISRTSGRKKADALADAINHLLQNLVIRCAKEEGIRDYFSIGVIGYGNKVGPAFAGSLAGREIVPISDVGNMPARVEERIKKSDDVAGGILEQIFWIVHAADQVECIRDLAITIRTSIGPERGLIGARVNLASPPNRSSCRLSPQPHLSGHERKALRERSPSR
jgi:hypothetical protein